MCVITCRASGNGGAADIGGDSAADEMSSAAAMQRQRE
jgi:hypothetical protein